MTGSTTGQTNLTTATDSDDTETFLTGPLTTDLQALANLFESATGHDHSGAGKGKPIGTGGIGSAIVTPAMLSPVFQEPALVADLTLVANTLTTLVTSSTLTAGRYRVVGQVTATNPTAGTGTIEATMVGPDGTSGSSELTIPAGAGGFLMLVGYHTLAGSGTISLKVEANAALTCKAATSVFAFPQATHLSIEQIGS